MNFLANSDLILQISYAKTFKMMYTRCQYNNPIQRYSKLQFNVWFDFLWNRCNHMVGPEKVQNYSEVIHRWSLCHNIFPLRLKASVDSRASWICKILLRLILKNSISYIYSRVIACNRNFLIRLKKFSIPLKRDEMRTLLSNWDLFHEKYYYFIPKGDSCWNQLPLRKFISCEKNM